MMGPRAGGVRGGGGAVPMDGGDLTLDNFTPLKRGGGLYSCGSCKVFTA